MIAKETVAKRIERFSTIMREKGLKVTSQRLEIFRILAASDTHPGAEEVHRKLTKKHPMLSLDTVYRSLWLLVDLGLISTVGPKRDIVRFDANLRQHHHFTCIRCGMVRDFESTGLNSLPIPTEAEQFGKTASLHVEIRGICEECLKTKPH